MTSIAYTFRLRWRTPVALSLLCLMAILLPAQRSRADQIAILDDDASAFAARLNLIRGASVEVNVACYQFADDDTGLKILAALRQAVRRGVCVRILVDGHLGDNLIPKPMMQHLLDEGIQLREFHPDGRYKLELGQPRLHDKLLIVDNTRLLTGGRNLRDEYFGVSQNNYADRDILVHGQAASEANIYFLQRWQDPNVAEPTLCREEPRRSAQKQQHAVLNQMSWTSAVPSAAQLLDDKENCLECAAEVLDWPAEIMFSETCDLNVRFLHDIVGGRKDSVAAIGPQLMSLMSDAQTSILIESPYFVITERMFGILRQARQRGVHIRILTNSLATTDHPLVHADFAHQRVRLRRLGVEVWEFHGEKTLHSKALVIDGQTAMIGSYNFDVRSERANSEVGIVIADCQIAALLTASMNDRLRFSQQVPPHGPLIGFDTLDSEVDSATARKFRRSRLYSPLLRGFL